MYQSTASTDLALGAFPHLHFMSGQHPIIPNESVDSSEVLTNNIQWTAEEEAEIESIVNALTQSWNGYSPEPLCHSHETEVFGVAYEQADKRPQHQPAIPMGRPYNEDGPHGEMKPLFATYTEDKILSKWHDLVSRYHANRLPELRPTNETTSLRNTICSDTQVRHEAITPNGSDPLDQPDIQYLSLNPMKETEATVSESNSERSATTPLRTEDANTLPRLPTTPPLNDEKEQPYERRKIRSYPESKVQAPLSTGRRNSGNDDRNRVNKKTSAEKRKRPLLSKDISLRAHCVHLQDGTKSTEFTWNQRSGYWCGADGRKYNPAELLEIQAGLEVSVRYDGDSLPSKLRHIGEGDWAGREDQEMGGRLIVLGPEGFRSLVSGEAVTTTLSKTP